MEEFFTCLEIFEEWDALREENLKQNCKGFSGWPCLIVIRTVQVQLVT